MNGVVSGGLLVGESEARVAPGDFPVEGVLRLGTVRHEERAEFPQSGFHLFLGAARPIAGALAGRPLAVEPVGLRPQTLSSLEKCGVGLGVGLDRNPRVGGCLGRDPSVAVEEVGDAVEGSAQRRTQKTQSERR